MVHKKLEDYGCKVKLEGNVDGIKYALDDDILEELVKEYFGNSKDTVKDFDNFFEYIGINPWEDTCRGYFEYEGQMHTCVYDLIEKYQKENL